MSDTQNPAIAEAPVPRAIDSAVRGIFDQVFNTPPGTSDSPVPPAPDGTVILSEQPRIAQEEVQPTPTVEEIKNPNGNPVEEVKPEEPEEEETEEEEQEETEEELEEQKGKDEEETTPPERKASKAASKAFAEMRVQLKGAKKEIQELRQQLEEAKSITPDSEELEALREIVKGYAFTATEEYKTQVTNPYNKANARISELVQSEGATVDMDRMNEVALNSELDAFDKEEAYETIGTDAGLSGASLSRFVRMAKIRDAAIEAHGKFQADADKYVEELKASRGKTAEGGKYEVNLDNYTLEAMRARAKELGINSEITEDNLKHARHLAHKINNSSFMDGALAEIMQKELLEARGQIEALEAKVKKLRNARPTAGKGSPEPPENPKPTGPVSVNDVIHSVFDLLH